MGELDRWSSATRIMEALMEGNKSLKKVGNPFKIQRKTILVVTLIMRPVELFMFHYLVHE